jgi:hypothetical protein
VQWRLFGREPERCPAVGGHADGGLDTGRLACQFIERHFL